MTKTNEETSLLCKEEGNKEYQAGNWHSALEKYTKGLELGKDEKLRAVLFKNRSAVHLKCKQYQQAVDDASKALEIISNDPKALFRRGQAYKELEEHEKAYADFCLVQKLDPKNKEVTSYLGSLHQIVQAKIEKSSTLTNKVQKLYEILTDVNSDTEKRVTSANNLVALAKEKSGAERLVKDNVFDTISSVLTTEKNSEIKISLVRTVSELCKDVTSAKLALKKLKISTLINLLNCPAQEQINAVQYAIQTILSTLAGSTIKEGKVNRMAMEENRTEIDSIMYALSCSITNRAMVPMCRDAVIDIICKNVGLAALDWTKKFIQSEGVEKLLEVASEIPEYRYESSIETTENTRMIVAICLLKIYESHYDDKAKTAFVERIDDFIRDKLLKPDIQSKVSVGAIITTLLLGPIDVGNTIIGKEGILNMFLAMAKSDDVLQQRVACETLIAAASKKDKCQAIMAQGSNILKELYQSNDSNDSIKVRALVGLCKLGSLGGTDASLRPFAAGASLKLAEACRRFLLNPSKEKDMQRWACEGLSYLTLDAEVKEALVEDRVALRSIVQLAKSGDLNCLYGVVTTLVNLCNAYDKQEVIPEMVKLAKFAKQHIPEEHELDDQDFVVKRIKILADEGIASALVALSKTQSQNSKELIARVFNALCEHQENRGKVVAEGGTKALLNIFSDTTPKGKKCAAQSLARIAITMDPEVAFPGQRAYEVIKPLVKLLDVENEALENFEGLMALCNLASVSESTRQRIIKEGGLPLIEHYTFEHHEMIRRAAIQCTANMCASGDVIKTMEGKNDRFKYLFLCCFDEDAEIVAAASGAMCMVFCESQKLFKRIFDVSDWEGILTFLLSHPNPQIKYKGAFIVYSIIDHSNEFAAKIINSHCKEALLAISMIENPDIVDPKARDYAIKSIEHCKKLKLLDEDNAE